MSLLSILFVSVPELILLVITTLTVAGYKDIINFREKSNLVKLLLAAGLMVACSTIGRAVLPLVTFNFLVMLLFYPLIMISVYRHRVLLTILGLLFSLIILIIGEAVFVSIFLKILNISLQEAQASDAIRILMSFPIRALQLIAIIIVCRMRNISLSVAKLSIDEWVQIALFGLMIVSSMISIESGLKNISNSFRAISYLLVNIFIAVIFSSWMIYNLFKLRKRNVMKERIRSFELQRIRKLLSEGHIDHVIQLIDMTLDERRE